MKPLDAAKHLYETLTAPRGTVNVAAVPDTKSGYLLQIWVAPGYVLRDVPSTFDGYPVRIDARPRISADSRFA
ncbi:hypothetical protein RI103_14110 [Paraburkholderia sp. FT54]|uniref:hypothetical protein n=1 Tax=Paraburkholderia sp. FT54 TaxID=3074437 RepID=UPI00287743A4|nr:hypothetical protein [Paraburkholderia sp. FT54]WNC88833.1 hypothetical protein RI103_14110 [Paraburkholderia sp. FT54]